MRVATADSADRIIRIVFRYDDCSARSSLAVERGLVDAFARCGAQVTIGIIPFVCAGDQRDPGAQPRLPLPSAKAAFLERSAAEGHVEIALHGHRHQCWSAQVLGEFAGLPLQEQRARLREGRSELEARTQARVLTFIPPWNAYDAETLRAMEATGLRCLSASLRGPFPRYSPVTWLPHTCWLQGISQAVSVSRILRSWRPVIVIGLHDFDFVESGRSEGWIRLPDFSALIGRLAAEPDVRFCSIGQLCESGNTLPPTGLRPYGCWRRAFRRFPWHYRRLFEHQVLLTRGAPARRAALAYAGQAYVSCRTVAPALRAALRRRLARETLAPMSAMRVRQTDGPAEVNAPAGRR